MNWCETTCNKLCAMQGKYLVYPTMLLDCFHASKIGKNVQTASDLIGASSHLA